jgi:TRAP transporter TAXI family solute receptor
MVTQITPLPSGVPRRVLLAAAAATVVAWLDGCAAAPRLPNGLLRIASGGVGGVYYAYAQGIKAVVQAALPELRPVVVATAASVENLRLVGTAAAELGLTTADAAADGYHGVPPFTAALPVRALARLYESYVQLVVRADRPIRRLTDLPGRSVSIGPPGSGTELITTRLLRLAGVDLAAVHAEQLDPAMAAEAVEAGRLDGMFFSGGIPTGAIADLAHRVPVALVDLASYATPLGDQYGEVYTERTIPASTYGLDGPTPTVGVANYLVVGAAMDERVAYWLIRSLFEHRDLLAGSHPEGSRLDRAAAIGTYPVPLHPGAARYYREAKH